MAQITHLLDTHVVVWALEDSPKLKSRARSVVAGAEWGELAISDMTLLELAMLIHRKRILPDASLNDALRQVGEEFIVVPIGGLEAELAVTLSLPQGDPFDRVIVATALTLRVPLISADREIAKSGLVETIW